MADIGPGSGFVAADPSQLANPGTDELSGISGGGLSGLLSNNPALAGLGVGAAGLGILLANRPTTAPYTGYAQNVIGTAAGQGATLGAEGQTLIQSLISGQLPQGAEQQVQLQIDKAKNTARARFASLGQTGSTMEADTLADIDNQASALRFQIAQQMAQTGVQATQLATQDLQIESTAINNLMQAQMKENAQTSSAIGGFFNAIGGVFAKALFPTPTAA